MDTLTSAANFTVRPDRKADRVVLGNPHAEGEDPFAHT
jgi:hypothetical protein